MATALYVIDDTANEDDGIPGWVVSTDEDPNEEGSYLARFSTEILAEWFVKMVEQNEGAPLNAD